MANAGDSRTLLCTSGKPFPMSIDHKPDDELEFKRITAAGGFHHINPLFNVFKVLLQMEELMGILTSHVVLVILNIKKMMFLLKKNS